MQRMLSPKNQDQECVCREFNFKYIKAFSKEEINQLSQCPWWNRADYWAYCSTRYKLVIMRSSPGVALSNPGTTHLQGSLQNPGRGIVKKVTHLVTTTGDGHGVLLRVFPDFQVFTYFTGSETLQTLELYYVDNYTPLNQIKTKILFQRSFPECACLTSTYFE